MGEPKPKVEYYEDLPEACPEIVRQLYFKLGPYQFTRTFPYEERQPIVLDDGSIYHGQWDQENRNGRGRQIDINGTVYEGYWSENLPHGEGRMIDSNG